MENDSQKPQDTKIKNKQPPIIINRLKFRIAHKLYDYGEPLKVKYVGVFLDSFDK